MAYGDRVDFGALKGARVTDIQRDGNEELRFITNRGTYRMFHDQDCCESVTLEDVTGDLGDIRGEVLEAEEVRSTLEQRDIAAEPKDWSPDEYEDSVTWTFYKIGTAKGSVTLRWFGSSNGYYSESVDLELVQNEAIDVEFSVVDRNAISDAR